MDAARGVKGHGWPLYAGPRSSDGTRGVERSETRMVGQDLLVPFGETAKRNSPSRAKPESPGNSAIDIDSMKQAPPLELIQIHQGKSIPQPTQKINQTKKSLSQFNPHPIHPTVTSICFRALTHWREPATETR